MAEVILRCLAKDPAERFQSADEILRALSPDAGGATMSMDAQSRSRLSAKLAVPWWKQRAGRMTAGIAAALLVLAAAGAISRIEGGKSSRCRHDAVERTRGGTGARHGPLPLAVLPFSGCSAIQKSSATSAMASSKRCRRGCFKCRTCESSRAAMSSRRETRDRSRRPRASLGANMIVEGTVQAAGDRLRLVVNLHDVAARRQVWSEQFTGTRADLFTLQDAIYDGLVSALGVAGGTSPATRTAAHPTDDIEAYDLYLKGRDALRSSQDLQKLQASVDFFQQAIRKDGRFALAHAGLADASLLMYQETKDNLWAERARAAALHARDLDDQMPEVFYSLGSVYSESGKGAEAVVV